MVASCAFSSASGAMVVIFVLSCLRSLHIRGCLAQRAIVTNTLTLSKSIAMLNVGGICGCELLLIRG